MADLSMFVYNGLLEKTLRGVKGSSKVKFSLVGFSPPKDGFCPLPISFSKQIFHWFLLFMGSNLIFIFGGSSLSSVLTAFHTSFWRREPFTVSSFLPTQDLVCILRNLKAVLLLLELSADSEFWCLMPNTSTESPQMLFAGNSKMVLGIRWEMCSCTLSVIQKV